MRYFFVNLINEFSESKFLGGSPVLNGAKQVAVKHAQRNQLGAIKKWSDKDPYIAAPTATERFHYEIESREVSAREVSQSS